ncbi:MAG TPA: hypothetical protein VH854_07735 [Thermoanaerobaculia bacterium]|jgi:hypothetical protein|nr:hypothetical protein [Thermoanaerobaculia bacterium]
MSSCCAARPREYRRVPADRIPDLHPLLVEVTAPGDALRSYRCRQCGQVWQQHMVDGEALVVQVGWGNRPAAPATPRVVAARPTSAARAAPPPQARRRSSLVAFVLLAAVFFVISTLPPFVTGSLARGAWMARWIVGGLLLLLGVQTVLDLARKARKRA